jgi:alkylation response protein AidB-like acyl-CoA dehydrogenase
MFFAFNDEQRELQGVLRSFLEDAAPQDALVERASSGGMAAFDTALTLRLAREMGMLGATIPVEQGGSGVGTLAQFLIFRELGRVLAGGAFLASVLAAEALVRLDREGRYLDLLHALINGGKRAAVAGLSWGKSEFTAERKGDEWSVSGSTPLLVGASDFDVLVVFTGPPGDVACFLVEDPEAMVTSGIETLDITRPSARVELNGALGTPLGSQNEAPHVYRALLRIATLCIAAEQLGVAEKAQEIAVEHAKIRRQFGAPIWSFQAVRHRCANVAVAVEGARNTGLYAAWAEGEYVGASKVLVNVAKSVCVEAAVLATSNAIQILGGLGFTWEHPIHLYYRRSIACRQIYGSTRAHREVVARELLDCD